MNKRPVRLRLSRKKGFRLQALSRRINGLACVKVDRSSKKHGNPYRVGDPLPGMPDIRMDAEDAVQCFQLLRLPNIPREDLDELRGNNIACWCKHRQPCHGDVLLKAANAGRRPRGVTK